MSSQKPIAFFGATGGCVNAALVLALQQGYGCSALVRTPQKLADMLAAKGISAASMERNLQVVEGNAKDLEAVKATLLFKGTPVSKILTGIGMPPKEATSKDSPNKHICTESTQTILQALREFRFSERPFLILISTCGISNGPRDFPLLESPIYHLILPIPHKDKAEMEKLVEDAYVEGDTIGGWCAVRPSMLWDGESKGMRKIKVGEERKPAVGYAIYRDDVGLWIFEETVKGDASRWHGKKPTITY